MNDKYKRQMKKGVLDMLIVSKWSEAVGKQMPRKYCEIAEAGQKRWLK